MSLVVLEVPFPDFMIWRNPAYEVLRGSEKARG